MTASNPLISPKKGLWMAESMLLLVSVFWGASYGLAKTAVAFYPVLGFLAIRFCITSFLLIPSWNEAARKQSFQSLKIGIPLGIILLSIFIAETYGLSLTLASNAAFLISLCVVFTPFVEWLMLKKASRYRCVFRRNDFTCRGLDADLGSQFLFIRSGRFVDIGGCNIAGIHGDIDQQTDQG
ncbi:EamA family transporter [Verminephrobacter eiseniae]|nr:EamA family transporter [Verminephrobacter eiseniae]